MAKITTATIKKFLNEKYGEYDWKRVTKRKFEYKNVILTDVNGNDFVIDGKLNWRAYMDYEETEPVFIIDNGEELLLAEEELPMLPASCFQYFFYKGGVNPNDLGIFVEYKEKFQDVFPMDLEIAEDDIREYTILGFNDFFKRHNIQISCEQENTFSFYEVVKPNDSEVFNPLTHLKEMEAIDENINKMRTLLKELGMKEVKRDL